jgi:mannose-1-phosphate guanylyltransferase
MNALILSAGLGSRLGPYTKDIPKVMLPINGKPLLDILINKLLFLNINKIVINTYFKPNVIEDYVTSQKYSDKIIISREEKLLGTAGSLKENMKYLTGSNFMVMHGDNYFTDSLIAMLEFHLKDLSDSLMTMGTFITNEPELYGIVDIDNNGVVEHFYEKSTKGTSNVANSAIYMFKEQSIDLINSLSQKENDISQHLIPKFVGKIKSFPLSGQFIDIGIPERYLKIKSFDVNTHPPTK